MYTNATTEYVDVIPITRATLVKHANRAEKIRFVAGKSRQSISCHIYR